MSDNEALWINQAIHGDDHAFGFLVERYQKPVFSLCYRMLGNSRDAEDAAQESFIRAYIHLKKYDPHRSFATWLLSIASHYCIDKIRKRQLPIVSMEALPDEIIADRNVPNPEAKFSEATREAMIQDLIMKLKPLDRAAVILRYWHEYSEVEIAEALNLSVSAVKSRLYRARQALAESYLALERLSIAEERRLYESPTL
ncbi:MAG: sigma-70 family RNA polymerase sigma factor [Brevefilum sp.]|nr:sigma-70 family RNA polymerase sigma factor [Brevefilum sp.]